MTGVFVLDSHTLGTDLLEGYCIKQVIRMMVEYSQFANMVLIYGIHRVGLNCIESRMLLAYYR